MADLAALLLRTVARAFYHTEHILVIDALLVHSTLSDTDLAFALGMQPKALRKLCGRLKEDGLVSVQARAERRTDGAQSFYANSNNPRISHKDWYYLNFHRAIDSIKYRMYRLNKHVESLGAPTTEKKDYVCPRCKAQYTALEVLDNVDPSSGEFPCKRCAHSLEMVEEEEGVMENESMKRLNSQLEKILRLMQQIDAASVPENDFQTALSLQKPIIRSEANPGQQRTEVVDLPNRNLQSTRGMEIKPEKIAVDIQDDEDVKAETSAEAQAKREKEARQNALPEWIVKSTVSGEITAAGAKEERLRRERAVNTAISDTTGEEKKSTTEEKEDFMAAYWEAMEKEKAEKAAREKESEDEDDDEEDDEFEDVDVQGSTPLPSGSSVNGTKRNLSGSNTPALESSNATDDERETKRVRIEDPSEPGPSSSSNGAPPIVSNAAQDEPVASDEDDELEFEDAV